jgi:hypothetical protein
MFYDLTSELHTKIDIGNNTSSVWKLHSVLVKENELGDFPFRFIVSPSVFLIGRD